jgi:hypothetical protein
MAGRLDTRLRRPPVRIGLAQAREQNATRALGAERTSRGATAFGMREGLYASVGPRLRIDKSAGPNTPLARAELKPIGRTRRKAGYPPVELSE